MDRKANTWVWSSVILLGLFFLISHLVLGSTPGNIASCQTLDTMGIYTLTGNVVIEDDVNTCYNITTGNVTLDCKGFKITYGNRTWAAGINATHPERLALYNVTIQNCVLQKNYSYGGGTYGIIFHNVSSGVIRNNSIYTNGTTNSRGIYLINYGGGDSNVNINNSIENNTIHTSGSGSNSEAIALERGSPGTNITGNIIFTNGTSSNYGISITNPANNTLRNNTIITSGTAGGSNIGMYLSYDQAFYRAFSSSFNNIINNTILTNGTGTQNYGIYTNGVGLRILNNTIITNGTSANYGIFLQTFGNSTVANNTVHANGNESNNYGIHLQSASYVNVSGNKIFTNGTGGSKTNVGIYIDGGSFNFIVSNNISTNGSLANYGIVLSANSTNNTLYKNTVQTTGSESHGIFFNSTTDGAPLNNSILNNSWAGVVGYQLHYGGTGINETRLIDQPISNYSFNSTLIYVETSGLGIISFLHPINGSGSNLSHDIRISANSVIVESGNNSALNKPANITLYGVSTTFSDPVILKDGSACSSSDCTNFTSLNAGKVIFNVTGFSQYKIGERPASTGGSSGSGGGGSGGGGGAGGASSTATVEKVSFSAKSGETVTATYTGEEVGITEITLKVQGEIGATLLSVEKIGPGSFALEGKGLSSPTVGAYRYLDISANKDIADKLGSVTITFKVPLSWFQDFRYNAEKVILYRYTDQWTALPTTLLQRSSTHAWYAAETPGFSLFAITAEKALPVEERPAENLSLPPEEITLPPEIAPPIDQETVTEESVDVTPQTIPRGVIFSGVVVLVIILAIGLWLALRGSKKKS